MQLVSLINKVDYNYVNYVYVHIFFQCILVFFTALYLISIVLNMKVAANKRHKCTMICVLLAVN